MYTVGICKSSGPKRKQVDRIKRVKKTKKVKKKEKERKGCGCDALF